MQQQSNDRPKVYVSNKGTHNYSDAERFGSVVFVTKGEQSKFAVGNMARAWATALVDSSPDDYILVTSLTSICCVGCALFATKHNGAINLLLFRNGKYLARKLLLRQILDEGELYDGMGKD